MAYLDIRLPFDMFYSIVFTVLNLFIYQHYQAVNQLLSKLCLPPPNISNQPIRIGQFGSAKDKMATASCVNEFVQLILSLLSFKSKLSCELICGSSGVSRNEKELDCMTTSV